MRFRTDSSGAFLREAVGPGGKAFAAFFVACGLIGGTLAIRFMEKFGTIPALAIIFICASLAIVTGIFLFIQKRVVVDSEKRSVRVESRSAPFRRMVYECAFDDIGEVVIYGLKFGDGPKQVLYATALRTKDDEFIIFNPGLPDARENYQLAEKLSVVVGAPVVTGKTGEESDDG